MARFKFELVLSKLEAVGVRNTLQKIHKTIKDPESWAKGEYEEEADDNDDPDSSSAHTIYCLIGASRAVNGPLEDLTHAFMFANLPKGFESDIELCGLNITQLVKNESAVERFNDDKSTTHKKVLSWLRSLIAKADKIAKTPKKKKVGK